MPRRLKHIAPIIALAAMLGMAACSSAPGAGSTVGGLVVNTTDGDVP